MLSYKLYRSVCDWPGMVFPFWSDKGYRFEPFGSESLVMGMDFRPGLTSGKYGSWFSKWLCQG